MEINDGERVRFVPEAIVTFSEDEFLAFKDKMKINWENTPDYAVDNETGCWVWQRAKDKDGYGRLGAKFAHIVYYVLFKGAVPENLVVDHICTNKSCVNPIHLEAVTSIENTKRYFQRGRKDATPKWN